MHPFRPYENASFSSDFFVVYGIIIRMYCAPNEHNPPHIHIYYNENRAILDLTSLEFTSG